MGTGQPTCRSSRQLERWITDHRPRARVPLCHLSSCPRAALSSGVKTFSLVSPNPGLGSRASSPTPPCPDTPMTLSATTANAFCLAASLRSCASCLSSRVGLFAASCQGMRQRPRTRVGKQEHVWEQRGADVCRHGRDETSDEGERAGCESRNSLREREHAFA